MPSTATEYLVQAIRLVLVAAGVLVASMTVYQLATMPPAPPDSDGFVTGAAYFFGSIIFVLAIGTAGLGVILPTILGVDDAAGFNRGQRLLLKAAGVLIGGGFLVGLAFGVATELQYGFFLWLLTIFLGVLVVIVAVGWRVLEVSVRALGNIAESS